MSFRDDSGCLYIGWDGKDRDERAVRRLILTIPNERCYRCELD